MVALAIVALLGLQATGCGTIFYPERKGQRAGDLDTTVVILDGLGLFLFLVPGVIAFIVDFSNNTIYLPGGSDGLVGLGDGVPSSRTAPGDGLVAIRVGTSRLERQTLQAVVPVETRLTSR